VFDPDTIKSRLAKFEEQLVLLREVQKVDRERFIEDPKEHVYAAHLLQTAIQCIIDIGSHIAASLNLGPVERYREIADRLLQGGTISKHLAQKLEQMIGLRNLLIHEYLEIDLERLYSIIQEDLEDLSEFAEQVKNFIEANRR